MDPVCTSAFASTRCFGLYAMLMLVIGAFPALIGSVAVAVLSSRLKLASIVARVGGVWLTAFLASIAVTGYLAASNYYDSGRSDARIIGVTVGLIFAMVTAYVVTITRRAPSVSEAPALPPLATRRR